MNSKVMVEAKLRVEMSENRMGSKNPFYGSTMVKKVVEDTLIHDKDTRDDIAPYGIYATIAIDSKVVLGEGDEPLETKRVFDIKVSKHYLDHEGDALEKGRNIAEEADIKQFTLCGEREAQILQRGD